MYHIKRVQSLIRTKIEQTNP
jgi:hypothetical protein